MLAILRDETELALGTKRVKVKFTIGMGGPGSCSSSKALGYRLDSPGSILAISGVENFLHSYISRLVLVSTQLPIK